MNFEQIRPNSGLKNDGKNFMQINFATEENLETERSSTPSEKV